MPQYTVNTIVGTGGTPGKAQEIYPDLPADKALVYLNDIRRELAAKLGLEESANTINVTDGDPDYSITPSSVRIQQVYYVTSATQSRKLNYIPREDLDRLRDGWRTNQNTGTPTEYTLTWNNTGELEVVLLPAPNTTTAGGYPYIGVYTDIYVDVTAGSTFYEDVPSDRVYVEGIAYLWARAKHPDELQLRASMYEKSLNDCFEFRRNRTQDQAVRIIPDWYQGR